MMDNLKEKNMEKRMQLLARDGNQSFWWGLKSPFLHSKEE